MTNPNQRRPRSRRRPEPTPPAVVHFCSKTAHCDGGRDDTGNWSDVTCPDCLRSKPTPAPVAGSMRRPKPVPKPVPDELLYLCGYMADHLGTGSQQMSPAAASTRLRTAQQQCRERWDEQKAHLSRAAELLLGDPSPEVSESIARKLVEFFDLQDVVLPEPVAALPADAMRDPYPGFRGESGATRRHFPTD